ncbi:hypothetical protein, partial [Alistipes putredinis]|uniref:hypothetical protein n=1 Tax=Alistipes putredinis TaxID=28117 RepID=UPI003A95879E
MKTDFSEQVDKLRKEITAAIKAVLEEYGKTEMEFPDTVDAVYVIWFDHDGDPYECLVRRIQFFGEELHLVVEDKHTHELYEIDGPFELGARCINWLDEILRQFVVGLHIGKFPVLYVILPLFTCDEFAGGLQLS